ncbi:ADP-ribose pyrophosphatase YjhB (NUDIX family) [Knoellia remsis]|uniref:ADP-ribose pyrophosphatase YjhB (NUDIX family) n=1 Tax=Knoellia remsis TaxID=407159 RepID=A0A2T0UQ56_9MICO|nr:NUDIX domain-containing protein [Knoellia remsis]PRY60065.1 ADP-ribose pyrophosphatase YjhB (NUDIX family) [Knoellia remsis]
MIEVVARDGDREVARFALAHGADPTAQLARLGWTGSPRSAVRTSSDDLRITYAVRAAAARPAPHEVDRSVEVPRDDDLTAADLANVVPHQRIAAYAVVRSSRGILLTELSSRTNAAGMWNLPGGGLDPGEEPVDAVVREVHEETSQHVVDVRLSSVATRHWVGRAPHGRAEDFHAVRLFHTARCLEPSDPVILDVGGSTSAARWVDETELASLPLASSVPEALAVAGVPV